MITIRCETCGADPAGRWVQPPACIFIDGPPRVTRHPSHYRCRAHLSAKREEEIQTRERALGWRIQ